MIAHEDLPLINASLNAASAVTVLIGYVLIRRRQLVAHKRAMLTGVTISALFLASYLTYHFGGPEKKFTGEGWYRTAYFAMLISHVLLAVALVPMIVTTLVFAFRDRLAQHRKLARWTFGVWMYVSVTGVLVYFAVHA